MGEANEKKRVKDIEMQAMSYFEKVIIYLSLYLDKEYENF